LLLSLMLVVSATLVQAGQVKSNEPIELTYWSTYGHAPNIVSAFGATGTKLLRANGYPNATVKAELIPLEGFEQKYLSAFAAGKGPDMFVAMAAPYASDGGLNPVAVALPDDVAKLWDSKLAPYLASWGTYKGKRYGFAVDGIIQLLYINVDHFKEAKLDPDKPPRTVDEFVAAAKQLTKYDAGGKVTRGGYMPRYLGYGTGVADKFLPIVHIFGGRMLSPDMKKAEGYINSPESVAAFQFYHDLVYKHKVVNLDFGMPEQAFQRGMASMVFREGWLAADTLTKAPNINFKVYPYIATAKDYAPSNLITWSNLINRNSKHKEVAFDLFRLLATTEADVELHKSSGFPPVQTATYAMSNEYFATRPYNHALVDSLKKTLGPEYIHPRIESIAVIVGEELSACVKGTPAKQAADRAAKRIDEVLASF
jgi:ABC-type glycerol-3-phosphate transport system substrate-binding protein